MLKKILWYLLETKVKEREELDADKSNNLIIEVSLAAIQWTAKHKHRKVQRVQSQSYSNSRAPTKKCKRIMKSQEKRKGGKKEVCGQEISWETRAKCMSIVTKILVMQRNTRHWVEIISTQVILSLGFISTPMKRLCPVYKIPTFVKFGRINCRQPYPQLG